MKSTNWIVRSVLLAMGLICTTIANEGLIISEFMANKASNLTTRVEGQTVRPDWIEIYNGNSTSVNLEGWCLTDDEDNLTKWRFPRIILSRDAYLIVFASEKDQKYSPNNYPYFDGTYYHANFELNRDGEYLALVQPDGIAIAHEYWPTFPPQSGFVSYGKCAGRDEYGYFEDPTPRAPNAATCLGDVVADTKFSHDRGFYDAPFAVTITTETEGATIRYSIDGSTPTESHGRTYTGPINISTTTCLRAMAYKRDLLSTNVDTQTYIFPADVVRQDGAGFPNTWGHKGADYEMDRLVVNAYSSTIKEDFQSVPTVSLVMNVDDWFGPTNGIYSHPDWEDRYDEEAERVVSVEFFDPSDTPNQFHINAVVRIAGGSSTGGWKSDKLSMRLKFQEPYGPTKLNYPLFGQGASDTFDTLVLDARLNNAWNYGNNDSQRRKAQYTRDQFTSDIQNAMGGYGHHGRHVHLYLNGLYWGLYNLHERPDESFAASYFGGNKKEYDALKHNEGNIVNGSNSDYREMFGVAGSGLSSNSRYQSIRQYLDVPNFIDYMIANFYYGNTDWAHQNWYATRNRFDPEGRWRYHSWDAEKGMQGLNDNVVGKDNGYGSPTYLHQKLKSNAEYRLLFADRVYRHFFNEGVLTVENATALYQHRLDMVDRAVVCESARWGDNRIEQGGVRYTRNEHWVAQRNWLLNSYFPQRSGIVFNQIRSANLYPAINPPVFNVPSGQSLTDLTFSITNPNSSGSIYYTTDGTDPRQSMTGNPVGTRYTRSITLTTSTHIKARVRSGVTWSALNENIFSVGPVAEGLRITEIMYNPLDTGEPDDPNREFIELKNIGLVTLNLNMVRFTDGIDFTFPNVELTPDEYILVVKDLDAFTAQYGPDGVIAGEYSGSLSNSGERIKLEDAAGQIIHDFSFQDDWYDITDGEGFSLTIVNPRNPDLSQWDNQSGWRPSVYVGGSPGWDDAEDNFAQGKVIINELLAHAHAEAPDWIELYNTTSTAVDIGGWFLSDSETNPMKYEIAAGTMIEPHGYIVFFEDLQFGNPADPGSHVPFALSENGETLYLNSGRNGMLTEYSDQETFGASETGVAFGRYRKSTGAYNFVAMSVNTPGSANAYPKVGPVVISEIMYNPASGNQDEEYIELHNISDSYVILAEYDDEYLVEVPWRLTDDSNGIEFDFPIDTMLAPDERLLLVKDRNIFNQAYPTAPNGARILEWGAGRLNNAGEKVQLSKPGDQVGDTRFYIRMDRVNYSDGSHPAEEDPWPIDPDGFGASLTRIEPEDYGNDPENWTATNPSPGL
ncbi:lamin tail domain-containing protein [Planctomycetota bacterium]